MLLGQGFAVLLLLLPAWALGAGWLRLAWRTKDAHTCLVLGAVLGLSAHIVLLNGLCYWVLPKSAGLLLCVTETLGCLVLWFAHGRRVSLDIQACAADVKAVWPWLLPVALVWIWHLLRHGTWDQHFHASLTAVLEQHRLPCVHPYDTGQTLLYHLGLDLTAASLGSLVGLKPWFALNVLMAVLAPLALGACVEFLRAAAARDGRGPIRAELAGGTLLFALGGNFSWFEALRGRTEWLFPYRGDFACDGIAYLFFQPAALCAWTWLFAVLALALRWPETAGPEGTEAKKGNLGIRSGEFEKRSEKSEVRPRGAWGEFSPAIPLGLMLAAVCLLAEHAALALAAALALFTARRWYEGRKTGRAWAHVGDLVLGGALGLGLALVQGGIATGLALKLSGSASLRPAWSGTWLPSFPTQQGRVWPGGANYLAVLFREYAHTLCVLPFLAAWAWSRRCPTAVRWLVGATLPGALVSLYTRFPLNDFDTYRFYQLYFGAAMLATGVWLARRCAAPSRREPCSFLERIFRREAMGTRLATGLAMLLALPLGLQGVRVTVAWAVKLEPQLPFDFDPGQVAALKEVERLGGVKEGILSPFAGTGFPASPGVLGVPVSASDPDTDTQVQRSKAWLQALRCPSPFRLRTAGTRWVCFASEDLARAVLLLEGMPEFQFMGAFGADPRYRLYRYGGSWSNTREIQWQAGNLERHLVLNVDCNGRTLRPEERAWLGDGNPSTGARFSCGDLASAEGLRLDLRDPSATVTFVWVLGAPHLLDFRTWGGLQVDLLAEELSTDQVSPAPRRVWTSAHGPASQVLWKLELPHAWGLLFTPRRVRSVRIRLGLASEDPAGQADWREICVGILSD